MGTGWMDGDGMDELGGWMDGWMGPEEVPLETMPKLFSIVGCVPLGSY